MRILVTGGLGFIASNFVNRYCQDNYIVIIDRLDICSSIHNIKRQDMCEIIIGDICDKDLLLKTLRQHKITHVAHFAAQSHVDNSFRNPMRYTVDNVIGTQTVLEACMEYGQLTKILHVSTDEVYGESNFVDTHKTEMSVMCPTNPYSASKAAAELITGAYQKSYNLPIVITRGNNVYGPRQYPEKLIPKFICQLIHGKKCTIHGDGGMVRGFVYVDDVVEAYYLILQQGQIGEIYNIGSPHEYSVTEISRILIRTIKNRDDYDNYLETVADRPYNDKRYFICNDKLTALGWTAKTKFEDGIQKTVDWYRDNDINKHWQILPNDI